MAILGSVYHDFPRLAKQSGFYFQLHTGRVNWPEIENLNLDEIVQKRNYHLLEQNLINVINCNLEREYDLKILDQNFVKLFKLAQLGIDYLFYCQTYLDRCVVLLQEQLSAFQQECESVKQDNGKRKEESNKSRRKNRAQTQNYQCEKCEKVFISDVYLKFHDKRRHGSPNTPNSLSTSEKKCVDNSQQTEDGGKLSTSTQTLCPVEAKTTHPDREQSTSIKSEHTKKIENLELELKNLKERLQKAESSLTEKTENSQLNQSNVLHPLNVTGSVCCNSMLMFLPSYLKQQGGNCYEINPGCQIPVQGICQPGTAPTVPVNSEPVQIKPQNESISECNTKSNTQLAKPFGTDYKLAKDEIKISVENTESFQEYHYKEKESLDYDKENIDPNLKKNSSINSAKPLPPPRRFKKGMRTQPPVAEKMLVEAFSTTKKDIPIEEEIDGFGSQSIIHRSTPIKEKTQEETDWDMIEASRGNLTEINRTVSNSTESVNSRKSASGNNESKSLIKKILDRNSPKLRRFSQNLKRSLTNLYDSIPSAEKDAKKRESNEQNPRATVVDGLNNRLRELGVDPEWRGIPKKTMKQKLKVLKHRRKQLSKENPMFPIIRQNLEAKIFQKIKNNLGKKKTTLINKLTRSGSTNCQDLPAQEVSHQDTTEFVRVKKSVMYDTDTDSESHASDSESNFNQADQSTSQKSVFLEELTSSDEEGKVDDKKSKEFDFSVFQVGGGSSNCLTEDPRQKNVSVKLFTDSDSEDNSVQHSEERIFKTFKGYFGRDENSEAAAKDYASAEQQLQVSHAKVENHGILKDNPDGIEAELSDSPNDDELWPFKSDSEKDVG